MKSITVGIPVYNESSNITALALSLKNQESDGSFFIQRIIICDDGSTDATVKNLQDLLEKDQWLSQKVLLLQNEKNSGKSFSLKKIFSEFLDAYSDFLVLFDSDMLVQDHRTLIKLLEPFELKSDIGMVGGWYAYPKNSNPLSRVLSFSLEIIKRIGYFQQSFVCSGGVLCLKRDFVVLVDMPAGITRIDLYLYLQVVFSKFRYAFQPEAVVTDIKDFSNLDFNWFVRIQSRSTTMPDYLRQKYAKSLEKNTKAPLYGILLAFIASLLRYPLNGIYYLAYKLMAKLRIVFDKNTMDVLWRK